MRIKLLLLVLSVFLLTISSTYAFYFDPVSVGTRASAMGGAYIGLADDVTSIYWNPAGLSRVEKLECMFSTRAYENSLSNWDITHTGVAFAGAAIPFEYKNRKMSFAVGFSRQLDPIVYHDAKLSGGVYTWSPSYAIKVTNGISFGLSYNFWTGKRDYDGHYWWGDSEDYEQSVKFSGNNFVLGTQLDIHEYFKLLPIKVGFILRSPFDMTMDYFEGNEEEKIITEIPFMYGGGIEVNPIKGLIFSMDVENRLWSNSNIIHEMKYWPDAKRYSISDKDRVHFRYGAEYSFHLEKITIAIRGGLADIPTFEADIDNPETIRNIDSGLYSYGIGVSAKHYSFDFSWSRERYERTYGDGIYTTRKTISGKVLQLGGHLYFKI